MSDDTKLHKNQQNYDNLVNNINFFSHIIVLFLYVEPIFMIIR